MRWNVVYVGMILGWFALCLLIALWLMDHPL